MGIVGTIGVSLLFILRYTGSPRYLKQRIKDKDVEIEDWKHKYSIIRGKYSRSLQGVMLPPGTKPIETPEQGENLIPSLIENFGHHIPAKWRPLLKNKQVQDVLSKIYGDISKDYPAETTEFINGMIPAVAKEIGKIDKDQDNSEAGYL